MVWERPAIDVARELGISDVALGKLCRRLQVPKPPRGYWAKIAAGKIPERPPLEAFQSEQELSADSPWHKKQETGSKSSVRLTKMQMGFLERALDELIATGVNTEDCQIVYDGIREVAPNVAAQVIMLLQNRYEKWIDEEAPIQKRQGAFQSIRTLVSRILPLAKEQVLVFREDDHATSSREREPAVMIWISAALQGRIATSYHLVRDNSLAYVALPLNASEHALVARYLHSPNAYGGKYGELCISMEHIWVRYRVTSLWDTRQVETERLPLRDVIPLDLLCTEDMELPSSINRSTIQPYASRLQAIIDIEHANEIVVSAAYKIDGAVPDENLALVDRLWFGNAEAGPFITARRAWRNMEVDLERWEQVLEHEKEQICKDVLGIRKGDTVVVKAGGNIQRILLEGASLYVSDDNIGFHLWGKKYRKDGLPGKRQESIYLQVDNDLRPSTVS